MRVVSQLQPVRGSNRMYWVGSAMSGLVIAFLLMDAIMKLMALPIVIETSGQLGFGGAGMAPGLGAVLLICTMLYAAP